MLNPPTTRPAGAFADMLDGLRRHTPWHLAVVLLLCVGIALIITAMHGSGFFVKLVYSVSIGLISLAIVDVSRLGMAWLSDHLRRRQGLPLLDSFNGWYGSIPGSLLAMVLGPLMGLTLADGLTGLQSPSLFDLAAGMNRVTLAFSLVGTLFSIIVIGALERLATARAAAEASQRQVAETQLRLLQSQLEPHMLFNTLANLRVLIGLEPQRAQHMLDHLIAFLRATLSASRQDHHALATEFERVADYLALMSVRMGPRLQVQLDLPEALRQLPVPPLLLQPLVENAIKHGLEPQVAGGRLLVRALQQGQQLHLLVSDTGQGPLQDPVAAQRKSAAEGSHFGLAQIKERLSTLYGTQAHFSLDPNTGPELHQGMTARITMPLPTLPATLAAQP